MTNQETASKRTGVEPIHAIISLISAPDPLSACLTPFPRVDIHAMIPSEDAPSLESALHRRFLRNQVNKVNRRKEFFRLELGELREVVKEMGIQVQWTITSEAAEYRETLALEGRMKENPESWERWVKEQVKYQPQATFDEEAIGSEDQPDPVGEEIARDALGVGA